MAVELDAALRAEYAELWRSMEILPSKANDINATAHKIVAGKERYEGVQAATGVPWYVVGLIHQMECGGRFDQNLCNGDSLSARTHHVPRGRPSTGSPPFTWEEAACDAIRYDGLDKVKDWSIEGILYRLEGYNGWGYRRFHSAVKSPYLWSGSNHYSSGKYVGDGSWSSSAVSGQSGAAPLLKRVMELDTSVAPAIDLEPLVISLESADEPLSPKAEEPATAAVAAASSSPTIWAILAAPAVYLGDAIRHGADFLAQLFGVAPRIADDVVQMQRPLSNLLGILRVESPRIGIAIAIVCLVVAIIRHIDEIRGNHTHAK